MPGTILKQLTSTAQDDNTTITAANSGFNGGGSIGSGNTAVFLDASKMGEAVGFRFTQGGANQTNWYIDLDAAGPPIACRAPCSYSATPTASAPLLRFYTDTGHATNLGGFLITTTNRLQFVEGSGTTPLNVTSPSGNPMVPGTAYVLQVKVDINTDIMEAKVFARGSATPLFTLSGTLGGIWASAAGAQAIRGGIGAASALAQLNFNNTLALGSGDYLARTDVSNVVPTANAGVDFSVEAGETYSIVGSDSDSDGTVVARQWKDPSGTVVGTAATLSARTGRLVLTDTVDTYTYTVTDDAGGVGVDTVNVTQLAAARRMKVGGTMRPVLHRLRLP